MVTDNERNYQGTNFVVAALVILLVLVGGYFVVTQISHVMDYRVNRDVVEGESADSPNAATAY